MKNTGSVNAKKLLEANKEQDPFQIKVLDAKKLLKESEANIMASVVEKEIPNSTTFTNSRPF